MTKRLEGKVAIVTGAAGDIGRAIVHLFAQEGAKVLGVDISLAGPQHCDVQRRGFGCGRGPGRGGKIRCRCMSWSMPQPSFPPTSRCSRWTRPRGARRSTADLTGAFLMSKFAVPAMVKAGSGSIIHMASQMGSVGAPGRAAYGVTKAGLIQLARIMALDHGPQNIRVNSLSPGAVMSSRVIGRYGSAEEVTRQLAPLYALGRVGTPEEVASAALFLASDESSFVTGSDLLVDGGYTAQ